MSMFFGLIFVSCGHVAVEGEKLLITKKQARASDTRLSTIETELSRVKQ